MTTAASSHCNERVVCLIDMDCFYVQVEQNESPEFLGKPCGVSQYNPYRGGGLIAVNYEARDFGVKRGMRGEDAKKLCADFHIFYVNQKRGKADLTKYREASAKIFEILLKHCVNVEKASIDEAYLDVTELVLNRIRNEISLPDNLKDSLKDSYLGDSKNRDEFDKWLENCTNLREETSDALLFVGALIAEEIRQDIYDTLGFKCSAGVAHNKTLAKLCCGLNKPNKQTILPLSSVASLLNKTPIHKIKNLGGKLGVILTEELKVMTMGDLARIDLNELVRKFGEKTGVWLNQISHGYCTEAVKSRSTAKSIGCSKNFRGNQALNTVKKVKYWIMQLCEELEERLDSDKANNQREANNLVVHLTNEAGTFSKTTSIHKYCAKHFSEKVFELLSAFNKHSNKELWQPAIFTLGVSAGKFAEIDQKKSGNSLIKYFNNSSTAAKSAQNSVKTSDLMSSRSTSNLEELVSHHENSSKENSMTEVSSHDSKSLSTELTSTTEELSKKTESLSSNKTEIKTTKNDIKALLLNQKAKNSKHKNDDSDNDADFNSNEVIYVDEETKSSENDERTEPQKTKSNALIHEDIDFATCEVCNKRILCWDMPEHMDYHVAEQLSKELNKNQTVNQASQSDTKKRSMEETPKKIGESSKKSISVQTKRMKTDQSSKASSSNGSIASFFQKKS